MKQREDEITENYFRMKQEQRGMQKAHVACHLAERTHIAREVTQDSSEQITLGQRLTDKFAAFGGSETFILLFAAVLGIWILLNSFILIRFSSSSFDPYPYILLNLFVTMLAVIQAPIIVIAQNRQAV